MYVLVAACVISLTYAAVPPDACFETFRWEDCGAEPKPVMYYWKPGSRCEVGIWRGCRPSLNMFKDEYECVTTCIFSVRVQASDFHDLQAEEEPPVTQSQESDYEDGVTEVLEGGANTTESGGNATDALSGSGGNVTETGNATVSEGSNATQTDTAAAPEVPTTTPAA